MEDSNMLAWWERKELDAGLEMTGTRPRTGPPCYRGTMPPSNNCNAGARAVLPPLPRRSRHYAGASRVQASSDGTVQTRPSPSLLPCSQLASSGFPGQPRMSCGHNDTVYEDTKYTLPRIPTCTRPSLCSARPVVRKLSSVPCQGQEHGVRSYRRGRNGVQ